MIASGFLYFWSLEHAFPHLPPTEQMHSLHKQALHALYFFQNSFCNLYSITTVLPVRVNQYYSKNQHSIGSRRLSFHRDMQRPCADVKTPNPQLVASDWDFFSRSSILEGEVPEVMTRITAAPGGPPQKIAFFPRKVQLGSVVSNWNKSQCFYKCCT